jgi:hypothetical protein
MMLFLCIQKIPPLLAQVFEGEDLLRPRGLTTVVVLCTK